jgi:hypothetical protein
VPTPPSVRQVTPDWLTAHPADWPPGVSYFHVFGYRTADSIDAAIGAVHDIRGDIVDWTGVSSHAATGEATDAIPTYWQVMIFAF